MPSTWVLIQICFSLMFTVRSGSKGASQTPAAEQCLTGATSGCAWEGAERPGRICTAGTQTELNLARKDTEIFCSFCGTFFFDFDTNIILGVNETVGMSGTN